MSHTTPLLILAACGLLSAAATQAVAAADTSKWTCSACPYEKAGVSGSVEAGAGAVTGERARYGADNGLNGKRGFGVLGGTLRYRDGTDLYGSGVAEDIGLDMRALAAELGREGSWRLNLGVSQWPHQLEGAGRSPFIGAGSGVQTLPFPAAASPAQMPLASSLQPVDLGTQRTRSELSALWIVGPEWTHRVSLRHDVRDGTQRLGASFFSTSSLLAAPVDQTTDQLELSTSYAGRGINATLAYQASIFRNAEGSVTWSNPYNPVVAGASRGQLALAPSNQFHQLMASGGIELAPRMRLSGDVAIGRMTQDEAFLAPTLNPTLAVAASAAMPAASLDGRADTFNASVQLSAAPAEGLRLNASVARNVRDNQTTSRLYPALSTDTFLDPGARRAPAFSFKQNRFKAGADYRIGRTATVAAGVERDERIRSWQDVVSTRETTLWARGSVQPTEELALSLKVSRAERDPSSYGSATWVTSPQNPLLRKFNLAERDRETAALRADLTLSEALSIGLHVDLSRDTFPDAVLGMTLARNLSGGADIAYTVSEQTQLHAFAQAERMRSMQAGSEAFGAPDWWSRSHDTAHVLGFGVKHSALKGRLEVGGDVVMSRSRANVGVVTRVAETPYPTATQQRDSLRLHATWKLKDGMSIVGRYAFERQAQADWRLDGLQPDTLVNLLALGETPPNYRVNVFSVALRYSF